MKVPTLTTTRTQAPSTATGYMQANVDPNAFGAGIGQQLTRLGAAFKAEEQKKEKFDVSRLAIAETTALQQDFHQRQIDAPLGADGFSQQVLGDYASRHESTLQQMREQGFSEEAVREMDVRLAGLRNSMLSQALTFQTSSYQNKIIADMEEVGTNLTQLASMNPYEMEAAIEELNATVDEIPNLTADQRLQMKRQNSQSIKIAAGMGLAQQDPGEVVRKLTGQGTVQQIQSGIRRLPIATDLEAVLSSASGVAGVDVVVTSGGQPSTGSNRTGSTRHDHGNAADISLMQDGRELDYNNPADLPLIQQFVRSAVEAGATGIGAGPGYMGKKLHIGFGERGARGGPIITWGKGGKSSNAPQWLKDAVSGAIANSKTALPTDGQTGNSVLDALNAQERMQVLGAARTALNQQQVGLRGPIDQALTNAEAAYMNTGDYAGWLPSRDDLHRAFDPVTAESKWAALTGAKEVGEFIQGMRTQSNEDIAATLSALRPTDTASPTYAVESKVFESAQRAANEVMTQRNSDPANYVISNYPGVQQMWGQDRQQAFLMMDEAYDQLGILPENRKPMPGPVLDQVKSAYNSASPEGKLGMLQSWRGEMGGLYGNALQQMADAGMPVEAYLSGLMAESPGHSQTAANVLRGMEMIAHDKSLKPAYGQINPIFRDTLGDAQRMLNPQVSQAINEAATALYVFQGGDPDTINTSLFEGAIREVLGGMAGNSDTGIADLRPTSWGFRYGSIEKTILPPNVTTNEFVNWKDGMIPDDLIEYSKTQEPPLYGNGSPVPVEDIVNEGVFVKVGPNDYIIKMASDSLPLVTADGDYYRMQLPTEVFHPGVELGPLEYE